MSTVVDLKDYEIPRAEVKLSKGKVMMVRGLSGDDLTFLISIHNTSIIAAIHRYQEAKGKAQGGNPDITQFVLTLARDFPDLVAEVISAANDSLDDATRAVARKLPLPVQLSAMNEIMRLTLEEVGSLKNLLAEMRSHLQNAVASAGEK